MRGKKLGCLTVGGLIAMFIALIAVGTSFALTRSKMFSPGKLSQQDRGVMIGGIDSHSDLEENCAACHPAPWSRLGMTNLCVNCHQEITQEMTSAKTLHGAVRVAFAESACQDCHTEHQGADANITDYLSGDFPHDLIGFSLRAHDNAERMEIVCQDCHLDGFTGFSAVVCQNCHQELDSEYISEHTALYSTACLDCHDGLETYGSRFDHNNYFPLVGQHEDSACVNCHAGAENLEMLKATPQTCYACHSSEDAHSSSLGQECEKCHSPQGWLLAQFDHEATGFTLTGGHNDVVCSECHVDKEFQNADPTCASCHLADDLHGGVLGQACETCHVVSGWADVSFDHTGPFAGECLSCHGDDTPNNHYPGQCSACHNTYAWKPASFDHQVAGATDCVACHTNDKPRNHYSGQCSACHSTNAWLPASFDHQVAGATDCVACHDGDAPANHFSGQCSSCHSTNAWKPASFDHTFPMNHGKANQQCDLCHTNQNYTAYTCYECHEHTPAKIREEHDDVANIDNCVRCHWDGREHENEGDDDD